jgi:transposase
MNSSEYTSKTLDHLGLVAGMCREIGVGDIIDACCPSDSADQIVSTGKAVEAMILNGLGFVNKRLYLVSRFFEDKPLDRLLGPGISADQLNDDRLGRALDKLYETGLTTIFTRLSRRTFEALDYQADRGHLDSTSMLVYGRYNSDEEEVSELHIVPGYSKDHRPDLPQVTLQLICEHLAGIPMHMEVLNGNSSDSESFRHTIQTFGDQLYSESGLRTIVADSKLYSEATLTCLTDSGLNWISRVPGTLYAVKELLSDIELSDLEALDLEGYHSGCYTIDYAGVDQHWVVYHSQSAARREGQTMQKRLDKEAAECAKSLKKLLRQQFHCKEDAQDAAQKWPQQWKWHGLDQVKIVEDKKYGKAGRPTSSDPVQLQYRIEAELLVDQKQWERLVFERSLFILATNQEIDTPQQEEQLLIDYKAQHSVERGFRFIKDPNVVASAFYVQKPGRVAALMFVMTCCLLIYSALQFRIRKALEENDEKVPDQKGKPTRKPTTRWVFQLFVGIHELYLPNEQRIILNLKEEHRKIITLLSYADFYS